MDSTDQRLREGGSDIATTLQAVQAAIAEAATAAGRSAADVCLVAVSKTQPVDRLELALDAGQRVFGENRVQEAKLKWPSLRQRWPDLRLHLIGPLQTNKVREALALFDVIETVDRLRLAETLAREMERTDRRPDLLVEVNTGEEPQKAGVLPSAADAFIATCRTDLALPITGVMAIPPQGEEPSLHFALLADIAARNGLTTVSMGMSADYPIAVQFGATHVRVGTAIFGARRTPLTP